MIFTITSKTTEEPEDGLYSVTTGIGNDKEESNSRHVRDKYNTECTSPCSHNNKKNYSTLDGDPTIITRSVFGFVALSHIIWQARINRICRLSKIQSI